MPREKVTPEEKAMAAKDCAEGRISQTEAARRLGVDESTVSEWVQRYKANGASAFRIREHNAVYSEELKRKAVEEYLGMIEDYITYYNSRRLQRDLGVLTPMEKHAQFLAA